MKKKSERLKLFVKLGLGVGVVYYVLHSKMVDFESVKDVLFQPLNLFVGIFLMACGALSCGMRWYLLMRAQKLDLSIKSTLQLSMIGVFFNTFMPGTVGGDLIKAWYVAGEEPNRKTTAIFTIVLDRVLGLSVILFYAAVTLLFYWDWLALRPELQMLAYTVWAITGALFLGAVVFYSPFAWKWKWVNYLIERLRGLSFLRQIIDASMLYRNHLPTVLMGFGFSVLNILGVILLFIFIGHQLGVNLQASQYFFVVPLGLVATGLPLLPGGVGVGQLAFFTLFQWAGLSNPHLGGALVTLFQIYFYLFNVSGIYFYLKFKGKAKTEVMRGATALS